MKPNYNILFALNFLSIFIVINVPLLVFSQIESEMTFYRSFEVSENYSDFVYPVITNQPSLTTYYWGENNDGFTPKEIIYIASFDKIYLYGSRGIDVINPTTLNSETVISICDYGQYYKDINLISSPSNRMVYNGENLLYCLTDELRLVSIDLQTNTIVNSVNLGSAYEYYQNINYSCLKYDNIRDLIFLSLSIFGNTCYYKFNATDISQYSINFYPDVQVYDFEINRTSDNLFVCYSQIIETERRYYFTVYDFNFNPVEGVPGFETTDGYRYIEYIFDPINNINEAICFPFYYYKDDPPPNAHIINGESFYMSSVHLMDNQTKITSSDYSPTEHIIYFSYNTSNRGIGKFHLLNNEIEDIYVSPTEDYISDLYVSESKIFLAEQNKIEIVDKNNPSNISSIYYDDDFILDLAASNNKIFAVNYANCSIESLDLNGNFLESNVIGGASLFGVHNSTYNKAYMYRYLDNDNFQRIYSMNLNNHEQTVIEFNANGMGWITDMVSDEVRNLIYVSIRYDPLANSNKIHIINAADDAVQPEGFALPEHMVCKNLYLANDKLYCLLEWHTSVSHKWPKIYIIDLVNPSNTTLLSFDWYPILEGGIHAWFDNDSFGNIYMSIIDGGNGSGKVIKIDNTSNQISFIIPAESPSHLVYNENNNKVYFTQISSSSMGIIDIDLEEVNYIDFSTQFEYLIRPFIDIFRNKLCVAGHILSNQYWNSIYTRFAWIDMETNEISDIITIEDIAISFEYNKLNGDLYSFYPRLWADSYFEQLGIISRNSFTNTMFRLTNSYRALNGTAIYPENGLFYDKYNNYLLIPNNYYSNFYRFELAPDQITLNPKTWNWLSFPRLEREGNNSVPSQPLMERIDPFPSYLKMETRELKAEDPSIIDITYDVDEGWSGELEDVRSTFGYKLYTNNGDISYLPMTGSILDPETQIKIYPGHENWVGYFLPETQSPFEAIPAELLPHLKYIKAQYWSCLNTDFISPHYKSITTSTGSWRCECNQGRIEMQYNDMVIMTLGDRDSLIFAWNRAGGGGAFNNKNAPENFLFKEKEDYEALFIDLDSIDLPDEIGAFAGDSCIGATKVLPDDTSAMICAYTKGFEGEEISFELIYSTKATRPVVDDYLVFNDQTRIKEHGKIKIGEKKQYYLVSFNKNKDHTDLINSSWIHCVPNPAINEATIIYFIPGEAKVKITLTNIWAKRSCTGTLKNKPPENTNLR